LGLDDFVREIDRELHPFVPAVRLLRFGDQFAEPWEVVEDERGDANGAAFEVIEHQGVGPIQRQIVYEGGGDPTVRHEVKAHWRFRDYPMLWPASGG